MRGMFATSDLIGPLADRGINLSRSQVYRLVAEPPERVSLSMLLALVDILECQLTELAAPVERAPNRAATPRKRASSGGGRDRSEAAVEFDPTIVLRAMIASPRVVCIDCGRRRLPHKRIDDGALCSNCAARRRPLESCGRCGRIRQVVVRDPPGSAVCNSCYLRGRKTECAGLRPDPRRRCPHLQRFAVPNLQAFRRSRVVWYLRARRRSPRPRPRRATDVSALLGRPGPAVRALRHRRPCGGSGRRRTDLRGLSRCASGPPRPVQRLRPCPTERRRRAATDVPAVCWPAVQV